MIIKKMYKNLILVLSVLILSFHFSYTVFATNGDMTTIDEGADNDNTANGEVMTTNVNGTNSASWLIIESYNVGENRLIAGEDNVLSLNIVNTNKKCSAYNVVITFNSNSNVILPQTGLSNQTFVDTIPAGGSTVVEIPISVASGATGDNVTSIQVSYDYYNAQGNLLNKTNSAWIRLPIFLSSVLSEGITFDESRNVLVVDYRNAGNKDVYNVAVHVSGELTGTTNCAIGNIAAGESGEVDIQLPFLSSGDNNLKVYYSYKNEYGFSIQSETDSYLVSIEKEIKNDVLTNEENTPVLDLKLWVKVGVAGLVALLSVIFGIINNKRKS